MAETDKMIYSQLEKTRNLTGVEFYQILVNFIKE